jgi:hypothetical protein
MSSIRARFTLTFRWMVKAIGTWDPSLVTPQTLWLGTSTRMSRTMWACRASVTATATPFLHPSRRSNGFHLKPWRYFRCDSDFVASHPTLTASCCAFFVGLWPLLSPVESSWSTIVVLTNQVDDMPTVSQAHADQYSDFLFRATQNGNYSVDVFVTRAGSDSVHIMAVREVSVTTCVPCHIFQAPRLLLSKQYTFTERPGSFSKHPTSRHEPVEQPHDKDADVGAPGV